jgi:hypothetical protein
MHQTTILILLKMKNKKGFCVAPFRNAEFLTSGEVWQCVSGGWDEAQKKWLNAWITSGPAGNVLTDEWKNVWNSEVAKKLRESMHNGSMEYCDEDQCGFLRRWNREEITDEVYDNGYFPIFDETTFHKLWNNKTINPTGEEKYKKIISEKITELEWGPECVIFSHDRSCNLKCPSCRSNFIQSKGEERERSEKIQEKILDFALTDANELYITASGDGFGGEFWRNLLKSITMEKYPNTKNLHIHTNGNGWTEKMWNYLSNLHLIPRITAEISIDACTKETYEQIRLGGNWDVLTKNLTFIFSKIPNLEFVRLTFVVQNNNYMEMTGFVEMADTLQRLSGMKTEVNFIHINNWGTFSESEFRIKNVANLTHPENTLFLNEVGKLQQMKNNYNNLQIYTNF